MQVNSLNFNQTTTGTYHNIFKHDLLLPVRVRCVNRRKCIKNRIWTNSRIEKGPFWTAWRRKL